ncbi:MAG: helix-turn-helix transcriptional regulator [Clostridia bacterium]|nr:helix-turn-helix transcriptional regulator [Clostridia bacterium]
MHEINCKIAKNLSYYRKAAGLTQAELAEKINYSDKSVSKWEQGNGVPDIYILMQLAKMYGVSLNDLVGEETPESVTRAKKTTGLKVLIILLSSGLVWLIATFAFVTLQLIKPLVGPWWLVFLYAVTVNAILMIVYATHWKYRFVHFVSVSVLIWVSITCVYLTILNIPENAGLDMAGLWCVFLLGIPLQALEVLWVFFRSLFRKNKEKYAAGVVLNTATENGTETKE